MRTSLSISVRRHFVDGFFLAHGSSLTPDARVIDIGGRKSQKRGLFDINASGARVTYVNLDEKTTPDIVADAASIPIADNSFDVAIMGELLEHVPNPHTVIREAYRVLCPGGRLLATVPFMYPVHADPHDHGRYTDRHLHDMLSAAGFTDIDIQPQGSWYAVVALALQAYFRFPERNRLVRTAGRLARPLIRLLMARDQHASPSERAWTTGYSITARKA